LLPAPPAPLPPAKEGDLLGGTRYRLLREIGRGASSVVYEAEHLDLGRRSAVKIITEAPARSAALAPRFRREARTLSRLSHPGLCAVHDVGEASDGRLFCVMDLLEGETLEALLAREKGLGYREALGIADRVLAALEVAHGAALVHRDIKPANVFLPRAPAGSVGALKLLDFGLARGIDEPSGDTAPESGKRAESTMGLRPAEPGSAPYPAFALFGTPEYMAPEQVTTASVDARADLYALGCVLYEMLTGRLPFGGAGAVAILDAKTKGSPERPRDRAPAREIPEAVDALVMKALARHPSERFQTATEMRLAIEAVFAAPARRGRSRLAAAGAMALIGALGVAATVARIPRLRGAAWLHDRQAVTAVVAAPAERVAAAADATLDEGGFDVGEDGDFADDTLPPAPAAAEPVVVSAVAAAVEEAAAAPAGKARHRKHAGKGGAKVVVAKAKPAAPVEGAPAGDAGAPKSDTLRHKHKAKVARVE
jgi:serine/threonine-protein kinase